MKSNIVGYKLSPQQEELWQNQKNDQGFSQVTVIGEGQLLINEIKKSISDLIERHEILRTVFQNVPGMKFPLQVVLDEGLFEWSEELISQVNKIDFIDELKAVSLKESQKKFLLDVGPTFRVKLVKTTEDLHAVIFTLPSAIADTWTLNNIINELENDAVEDMVQYSQFSEWANEVSDEAQDMRNNNLNVKAQYSNSIDLPFEISAGNSFGSKIESLEVEVSQILKELVRCASEKMKNTPENLWLAGWGVFLYKLTGNTRMSIKYIVNGRKHEEFHTLFGLIAQSMPLEMSLHPNISFKESLSHIEEQSEEALEYVENFTFRKLEGSLSSNLQFEYHFWNESKNLTKKYMVHDITSVQEPLHLKLFLLETSNAIKMKILFDANRFKKCILKEWVNSFMILMEDALINPDKEVEQLKMVDVQQKIKSSFNSTPICIHDLIEKQVLKTPQNIAVVCEGEEITYEELNARSNQLANYLRINGLETEQRVGICLNRSIDLIISMLGVLKAGGAYVPLDISSPKKHIEYILKDSEVGILLTESKYTNNIPSGDFTVINLNTDKFKIDSEQIIPPKLDITPDNLAYIIYTSGSTGEPKGVAVEHRQLFNYLEGISEKLNFCEGTKYATVSTVAADLGNTVIYTSLYSGGILHVLSDNYSKDANAFADYMEENEIDCIKIVPSHFASLSIAFKSDKHIPQKCIIFGGEKLTWDVVTEVRSLSPDCRIINHYGPTETTVGVLTYEIGEHILETSSVPIGKPLLNTKVHILDKYLRSTPIGVRGEIYIGGLNVSRGYVNDSKLNAKSFVSIDDTKEVYFKTGDFGRRLLDGSIEYLSRTDGQVKIRGYRVEINEVEKVIQTNANVKKVLVTTFITESKQTQLVAYLSSCQGKEINIEELQEYSLKHLPEYCVPSYFIQLDSFPVTSNGKIDHELLPNPNTIATTRQHVLQTPRTETELTISAIWKEVLQKEQIDIKSKFFEIGGDSLKLIRVLYLVNLHFSNLTVVDLFNHNTIESLSTFIEENILENTKKENDILGFKL